MPRRQGIWVKAIETRVAMVSSVLDNILPIKVLGLGPRYERLLHQYRVRELQYSKQFRLLIVIMNGFGMHLVCTLVMLSDS
jgi:hypothetical protein